MLRHCVMIHGTAASVSTLLTTVGLPNSPSSAGSGGFGPHFAALALQTVEQRGFFAAHIGARADPHLELQKEPPDAPMQPHGGFHLCNRVRIFAADVNIAFATRRPHARQSPCPRSA
jgi:hypothetical protein